MPPNGNGNGKKIKPSDISDDGDRDFCICETYNLTMEMSKKIDSFMIGITGWKNDHEKREIKRNVEVDKRLSEIQMSVESVRKDIDENTTKRDVKKSDDKDIKLKKIEMSMELKIVLINAAVSITTSSVVVVLITWLIG